MWNPSQCVELCSQVQDILDLTHNASTNAQGRTRLCWIRDCLQPESTIAWHVPLWILAGTLLPWWLRNPRSRRVALLAMVSGSGTRGRGAGHGAGFGRARSVEVPFLYWNFAKRPEDEHQKYADLFWQCGLSLAPLPQTDQWLSNPVFLEEAINTLRNLVAVCLTNSRLWACSNSLTCTHSICKNSSACFCN